MCFAPQWRALFRHFFDISTSKSGPRPSVFNTFDLEMCFAPQRRALFWHLNFQKWSDAEVFCAFWLGNVLRATTACTFSTSQLPKVVREWCVLYIFTWKCASRHNGVQFFISPLASWLCTRRFSEPTFRPSGATNHWKNTVFRDFPTFSRICIFCPLTLSLLIFLFSMPLPCSAFHLSILSEVWLLNFLRSIYGYVDRCWYIMLLIHRLCHSRLFQASHSSTPSLPSSFFIAGVSAFLVGNNWAATALYRIRGETLRHLLELLKHL